MLNVNRIIRSCSSLRLGALYVSHFLSSATDFSSSSNCDDDQSHIQIIAAREPHYFPEIFMGCQANFPI